MVTWTLAYSSLAPLALNVWGLAFVTRWPLFSSSVKAPSRISGQLGNAHETPSKFWTLACAERRACAPRKSQAGRQAPLRYRHPAAGKGDDDRVLARQ